MKALYVAASGMSAQQTRIDNIANNLANVNTTAYKRSREAFEDLLYQDLTHGGKAASTSRVELGSGVQLAGLLKDHQQGTLDQTGEPLHVAIEGPGFFALTPPEGDPVYTRDGSFTLDADGRLVSTTGYAVAGDIVIPTDALSVNITEDGTVSAILDGDTGETVLGQLEVVQFVHPSGLRSLGGNLYAETADSGFAEPVDLGVGATKVRQGMLEGSNVDVAEELVQMILAQRAYEMNSKVVQAADEVLQTAANLKR